MIYYLIKYYFDFTQTILKQKANYISITHPYAGRYNTIYLIN